MKTKNIILGIIIILVIGAIAYYGYMMMNSNSSNNQKSNQSTSNTQNQPKTSTSSKTDVSLKVNDDPNVKDPAASDAIISYNQFNLAEFNGKNGSPCYVAVDGKVYDLTGVENWVNGEHTPSGGQAKCGLDLTEVLKKSPHGMTTLKDKKIIGDYKMMTN